MNNPPQLFLSLEQCMEFARSARTISTDFRYSSPEPKSSLSRSRTQFISILAPLIARLLTIQGVKEEPTDEL